MYKYFLALCSCEKNQSNTINMIQGNFSRDTIIQARGRGNTEISRIILRESPYRWCKSAGSRNARTIMTRRIEASFLLWLAIQSPVLRFPVFRIAGGITTWEAAFSHVLLGRSPMEDRDEPGRAHIPRSQRALKLRTGLENLAERQK